MKAGRELDAKVATDVMEWKDVEMGRDDYGGEPPEVYNEYGEKAIWMPVPNYSTDIAAAWLVVEKMFKDDYYIHVLIGPGMCQCVIEKGNNIIHRDGDTVIHAICLASLDTVKGE